MHVYGLAEEKLLNLVENPEALINSLYNHELILKSSKLDFNTVIKEIGELHQLDIQTIQIQLLNKWLMATIGSGADGTVFEETFFEEQTLSENTAEDASNAAENVIR